MPAIDAPPGEKVAFVGSRVCPHNPWVADTTTTRPRLPRTVIVLGGVSLLMDVSSEMIHALLPVFLISVVGAGPLMLGLIEGVGEAAALFAKVVAGAVSDRMRLRKPLVMLGYLMSALAKPLFALAGSAGMVLGARTSDRLGKGVRGAPRDALIGDITPAAIRGAAFGLRQALDTVGAVVGPLLALLLLGFVTSDLRTIFWIATAPAVVCVGLLWVGVREKPRAVEAVAGAPWRVTLGPAFWRVAIIGATLQLARFSEAFVILRADRLGWPLVAIPAVLIAINVSYSLTAYPAGRLSDRYGRTRLLVPGIVALITADVVIATVDSSTGLLAGALLWGVHLGLTSGVLAAMVTDATPAALRGTGFGVFNLLSGVALLLASVVAGLLWQQFGPQVAFAAGASLAAIALLLTLKLRG